MNPYERRIIHSALQNDKFVETHSEGEEPYRKVVISLKRVLIQDSAVLHIKRIMASSLIKAETSKKAEVVNTRADMELILSVSIQKRNLLKVR